MVSVLTWLTDKTDNINLVIEVAVGIVVTARVAGVGRNKKYSSGCYHRNPTPM